MRRHVLWSISPRRAFAVVLAGPLCGLVLLTGPHLPAAGADDSASDVPFSAAAAADGFRLSFSSPGAPVSSNPIDGGGPTAQAFLSTTQGIRSMAALPYPGDLFLAGPGTVAGFLGAGAGLVLPFQAPGYPMIASAEQPGTPEQTVGDGPYRLEAKTTDRQASGTARIGLSQSDSAAALASSEASVARTAGAVVSSATGAFKGLAVGPLRLANVSAHAQAELSPTGELKRSSVLEIAGVQVAGTPIQIGSTGAPAELAKGIQTLNQQLAPSKVTLELSDARETADGITAPVLAIRSPVPAGPGFAGGVFTILIGGVSASIQTEASASAAAEAPTATQDNTALTDSPVSPIGTAPAAATEPPPAPSASTAPVALGTGEPTGLGVPFSTADDVIASQIASISERPTSAAAAEPAQQSSNLARRASPAASGRPLVNFNLVPAYGLVALGAAVAFGLIRLIKVRAPWTS